MRTVVPPKSAGLFVKLEWENPTGSLGLGAVSLAAADLPARRVLRLDPARILRHQESFRARLSRAHA